MRPKGPLTERPGGFVRGSAGQIRIERPECRIPVKNDTSPSRATPGHRCCCARARARCCAPRRFYIYASKTRARRGRGHYYAMCAVTRRDERVSAEGVEMSKYRYNGSGRFNISLKYLSSRGTVIYECGGLKYYTRLPLMSVFREGEGFKKKCTLQISWSEIARRK